MGENRLMAYLYAENERLKARILELEEKHWNECGQIAHYDDERRKIRAYLQHSAKTMTVHGIYEALALIGKDTNVPASADDINVGHKSGGWISCEDRLPEESGTYICAAKSAGRNIVTFVKWQPRYKQWNLTGARSYWQVTYWQPLPEPPKDGDTK